MFKFARYFFVVFLITTIIPLVLMLLWNHHEMERMMHEREKHLLSVGSVELEHIAKEYLKVREAYILERVQDLSEKTISLKQLKKLFEAGNVECIYNKKINKIESYYEIIKSELYNVSLVPYNSSDIKGIKIAEKADLKQFRPPGPFDVEVYLGDKTDKNSFLQIINDPYRPNFMPPLHSPPEKPFFGKNPESSVVKLHDNKGNTVVSILIKTAIPPKPMERGINPENELGLVILFTGAVLSLLVGFYINKNFINPLLTLSDALKQLQQGNLSFQLNTESKQEQIQSTFNDFNQTVKALKEKEELRKSFVTSLTHDLKTPLIAQERALGLISKEFESLGLKEAYELATGIEKNNKHLLRMVDLILESYRFDYENLNLNISHINIFELVDNCFEKLKPLALEKNILLLNKISADAPLVNVDMTGFKRIFLNLISNSINSIEKDGEIEISMEYFDNFIKIYIEDNGTGISAEDLPHIFDRYYTGKSDDRKLGSGLGLYVCKKLIEIHGGKIAVESEINKFTKFIITIPKLKDKAQ